MHIKFAEVPVSDQDRAIDFYSKYFDVSVAQTGRLMMTAGAGSNWSCHQPERG